MSGVKEGDLPHCISMVGREAIRHRAADVVAGDVYFLVTEVTGQLPHVMGHCLFVVAAVGLG